MTQQNLLIFEVTIPTMPHRVSFDYIGEGFEVLKECLQKHGVTCKLIPLWCENKGVIEFPEGQEGRAIIEDLIAKESMDAVFGETEWTRSQKFLDGFQEILDKAKKIR